MWISGNTWVAEPMTAMTPDPRDSAKRVVRAQQEALPAKGAQGSGTLWGKAVEALIWPSDVSGTYCVQGAGVGTEEVVVYAAGALPLGPLLWETSPHRYLRARPRRGSSRIEGAPSEWAGLEDGCRGQRCPLVPSPVIQGTRPGERESSLPSLSLLW